MKAMNEICEVGWFVLELVVLNVDRRFKNEMDFHNIQIVFICRQFKNNYLNVYHDLKEEFQNELQFIYKVDLE